MNGSHFSALLSSPFVLTAIASATLGFSSPALALSGFVAPFAPSDFTLSNTPSGDGTIDTTDAATGTVILTGSNDQTDKSSSTTWVLTNSATQDFTITFDWSFAGDSFPYDGTFGDRAGYLLNGTPVYLALQDGDGNTKETFNLAVGQTFGFIVDTANNGGSAGVFTASNFNATPVPFESDALPVVGSLALFGVGVWAKRRMKG